MKFCQRLKMLMEENNVSVYKLSKATKISMASIKRYIDNKTMPEISKGITFCKYFNVSMDYLLGLSDKKQH